MVRVLVTGAGGFVGRSVVAAALDKGFAVRALVRSHSSAVWPASSQLEVVVGDLRDSSSIAAAVADIDVLVHLAATKAGGFSEQFAGTVVTTENLLRSLADAHLTRIVHVSSFSVYDAQKLPAGAVLDETAPIIDARSLRDEYSATKLMQERLMRAFSEQTGTELVILRPGIIYGDQETWNSHLGIEVNDHLWLQVGSSAVVPITYVENTADAIVAAIDVAAVPTAPLNVVDDDLPTQREYRRAVRAVTDDAPRMVPVPWLAVKALAALYEPLNRRVTGGRAQPPGLFRSAVVHARFKPLQYSNAALKAALDWHPRVDLATALARIGRSVSPPT